MTAALAGIRVVEAATLFAAPTAGMLLGDHGADVIKVEHPVRPDPARHHGAIQNGVGLTTKVLGRNKRQITIDLSHPDGQVVFRRLCATADVVIENFRPGTFERWDLGYDRLTSDNRGLVMARVTGFGQHGPYARRPGFGTIAEAMSGFAAMTGSPDGPPTLPPFGLADGIAGLATAFAVLTALQARSSTGRGQVVDVAIIEPIMMLLGAQITAFDQLGVIPARHGNRSVNNAPRNLYLTADDEWVAISTSSQNIAERVMRLVGRPELVDEGWFATAAGRVEHAELLDQVVAEWVASRSRDDVLSAFEDAGAAAGPVYNISDIAHDEHLARRGTFVTIDDDDLGSIRMQAPPFRLSDTGANVRFAGAAPGTHTDEVLTELGFGRAEIADLRRRGTI